MSDVQIGVRLVDLPRQHLRKKRKDLEQRTASGFGIHILDLPDGAEALLVTGGKSGWGLLRLSVLRPVKN